MEDAVAKGHQVETQNTAVRQFVLFRVKLD